MVLDVNTPPNVVYGLGVGVGVGAGVTVGAGVGTTVGVGTAVGTAVGVGTGVGCAGGVMVIVTHFSLSITMVPDDSLLERNPPKKRILDWGLVGVTDRFTYEFLVYVLFELGSWNRSIVPFGIATENCPDRT